MFQDLGFVEIYERQIRDLVIGFIKKDGMVESVLIEEDGEETSIVRGKNYLYDTKIIITYHTYKNS